MCDRFLGLVGLHIVFFLPLTLVGVKELSYAIALEDP